MLNGGFTMLMISDAIKILTVNGSTHTVKGSTIIYIPAAMPATQNAMKISIRSQITENTTFPIVCNKNTSFLIFITQKSMKFPVLRSPNITSQFETN